MTENKYGLYKRIMKRDLKAIDEIDSLDEWDVMKPVCGVFTLFLYQKINKSHHEMSYSRGDK